MLTRDPWIRALVIVLLVIAGLYLAGLVWQVAVQFADIILLFFLAWVVAFILEPFVDGLQRHARLPRAVAVTLAYVAMLIFGAYGILWAIPALTTQVVQLVSELPAYGRLANDAFLRLQELLDEHDVYLNLATLVQLEDLVRRAESVGPPILSNAVAVATGIAAFIVQLVIVLMLSFYVMLDGHRIRRGLIRSLPPGFREDADFFLVSVNRAFAGFLRGQLIQALVYAVGTAVVMWMVGLDLLLLTAVVNTIVMMIPFFGPPLALILPLAVSLLERPDSFWLVFILINALQQVVINVIAPRVMSSAVGVHPLLVFLGLLAGAKLAGIWGALFGVPVVAVIAAMLSFYHHLLERARDAVVAGPTEAGFAPSAAAPVMAGATDAPTAPSTPPVAASALATTPPPSHVGTAMETARRPVEAARRRLARLVPRAPSA